MPPVTIVLTLQRTRGFYGRQCTGLHRPAAAASDRLSLVLVAQHTGAFGTVVARMLCIFRESLA